MSSKIKVKSVKVTCQKCGFDVTQEIVIDSKENYIYCPSCDNVFIYQEFDVEYTSTNDLKQNSHILDNIKKAYEEIPHTFIKSDSIYLKGFINGVEINFLLDTGAEMSVLPLNIVEASGLTNIMDTEYKGIMKGVGEAEIPGKIHYIELVLDCGVYPCAFTVCSNNNVPPILGIDMMHNLGISLDFRNKKIHFTPTCSVDFLTKSK